VTPPLLTALPFGYRLEGIKGTRKRRRPMSDIAHHERFGQKSHNQMKT
jgi:hypothetical protein